MKEASLNTIITSQEQALKVHVVYYYRVHSDFSISGIQTMLEGVLFIVSQ